MPILNHPVERIDNLLRGVFSVIVYHQQEISVISSRDIIQDLIDGFHDLILEYRTIGFQFVYKNIFDRRIMEGYGKRIGLLVKRKSLL
jgi:hypothetical protein